MRIALRLRPTGSLLPVPAHQCTADEEMDDETR
jgi:hypothetical protein